ASPDLRIYYHFPARRSSDLHLDEQSVDGLIVIAPQRQAVEALASLPAEQPVVVVEGGEAPGRAVVCVDQQAGAAAVTRHLLELGDRKSTRLNSSHEKISYAV